MVSYEVTIMQLTYKHTITACFAGYIVQAIVNNFAPLLFLTFQESYGIPLSQITLLITVNFVVQLAVDLLAAGLADRIGARNCLVSAHLFCVVGLGLMAILPEVLPNAFAGLLVCVILYAVGGGLLEVMVSPVVEACPTDNKEGTMSLLHSFYCWGQVGVVLLSTLFFALFGTHSWRILALIWAAVPFVNMIVFIFVPIKHLNEDGGGMKLGGLLRSGLFWTLFAMMFCAGASELAVSQWASTFAERSLGVSKTVGDLAGPMMFAVFMGTARAIYGKIAHRIDTQRFMLATSLLCAGSYLCIALVPLPAVGLIGCGICGFSVGIMWPGTFSRAAAALPAGGTMMFALLALAGDLGCSGGPTFAGLVASAAGDDLRKGILAAIIFPLIMAGLSAYALIKRRKTPRSGR